MAKQNFFSLIAGRIVQLFPLSESKGAEDAGKLIATNSKGKIDNSLIDLKSEVNIRVASEVLSAGKFVNLHLIGDALEVRLADQSNGRVAHGFVQEPATVGQEVKVYRIDTDNAQLSGLVTGDDYWLGEAGNAVAEPPSTGKICQMLGIAISPTELRTEDKPIIWLAE